MAQKKKNQAGIAVAVWILLAIVLFIIFLVMQDDIMRTLKDTGFFTHTVGSEPEFVANYEVPESTTPNSDSVIQIEIQEPIPVQNEEENVTQLSPIVPVSEKEPVTENTPVTSSPKEEQETADVTPPKISLKLFFVIIDGNGTISRVEAQRSVDKTNSPLTTAITTLLAGPNLAEREKDYMSLIPEGSRLLSASVKNKIATLNFSEEFEFNPYGVEGYIGQLMQIVYTATSFSTVESVQFLVEGVRKDYIGSEGVWIGSPLSSASFK